MKNCINTTIMINVAKILKTVTPGKELYSTMHGKVTLESVTDDERYPITVIPDTGDLIGTPTSLTAEGKYVNDPEAECVLFPSKTCRDWEKFAEILKLYQTDLQPFDRVLVRDYDDACWAASIFSHIEKDEDGRQVYIAAGCSWNQCIPYNDNTAHLLGTNLDCE